jgi:hypothetical protein
MQLALTDALNREGHWVPGKIYTQRALITRGLAEELADPAHPMGIRLTEAGVRAARTLTPNAAEEAPRMVATCCSCGADAQMPMDGPRPACTHNGETRPNGGIVIAGKVVRPAAPGTCYTDRHIVRDVARWEAGNYVPRCGECVAEHLGVNVDALPVAVEEAAPAAEVNADNLNDVMSFEHVVQVLPGGAVEDAHGVRAPEVYVGTDADGQISNADETAMVAQLRAAGWELLTGWTSQYSYNGPIMHACESIGGDMADRILSTPGTYVAVTVETLDDDEEPAGWVVAYRTAVEEERPAAEEAATEGTPARVEGHGYTWGDARAVPARSLNVGDVFVKVGTGTAYREAADGRVSGAGIAWEMPMDGEAYTVVDRYDDGANGATFISRKGDMRSDDIPESARVLRVAQGPAVAALVLHREPWRGGQICGWQMSYGTGGPSEFCGRFKALGERLCTEHGEDYNGPWAPGNAEGLALVATVYGWSVFDRYGDLVASANERAELERSYGFTLMFEGENGEAVAPDVEEAEEEHDGYETNADQGHRYALRFEGEGVIDSYEDAGDANDALETLVDRHIIDSGEDGCEGCGPDTTTHGYDILDRVAAEEDEPTPLDDMGTDELINVLRAHEGDIAPGSTFARAWTLMDRILTDGGIECLPAPWDGFADEPTDPTEGDVTPAPGTVYMVALAEPVKGHTMVGQRVRTEFVREALRIAARMDVTPSRVGNEGIIRIGSFLYIPEGRTARPAPAPTVEGDGPDAVEEAANLAARFMPQRSDEPGTHPYVALGDGSSGEILIGTRIEDGTLVLSVDVDGMDVDGPFLRQPDSTMPITLRVNGEHVYSL